MATHVEDPLEFPQLDNVFVEPGWLDDFTFVEGIASDAILSETTSTTHLECPPPPLPAASCTIPEAQASFPLTGLSPCVEAPIGVSPLVLQPPTTVAPSAPFHLNLPQQQLVPLAIVSRRGGSKKRKSPDLDAIEDEEERKREERKLRNKESAQTSRDRQKSRIAMLESAVQTMQTNMLLLQQHLVAQATENQHLKERMRQAELLLRVHGVDTDLLVKEDSTQKVNVTTNNITNCANVNVHCGPAPVPPIMPAQGPVVSGLMAFVLLFTFVWSFNFSVFDAHQSSMTCRNWEYGSLAQVSPSASRYILDFEKASAVAQQRLVDLDHDGYSSEDWDAEHLSENDQGNGSKPAAAAA